MEKTASDFTNKLIFAGVGKRYSEEDDDHGLCYTFLCLTCGESMDKVIWEFEKAKELNNMIEDGKIPQTYLNHKCKNR